MEQANYIKAIFTAIFAFFIGTPGGSGSAGNLAGGM